MDRDKKIEADLISAVKGLATLMNSGESFTVDISRLITVSSHLKLSNLDYWERLIRDEYYSALEAPLQYKWKACTQGSAELTWIDLCSWDGYKREAILHDLSEGAPNSFFFALVLRRLNDWVPEVRQAAREKLPLIAKLSEPMDVANALCLVLSNWNSWGRIEDLDKDVILEILARKEVADALKSKILSDSAGPLVSVFSQIGRTDIFDKDIDFIAHNAVQPSVRAKAYRSQFEGVMTWLEGRKWEWANVHYCEGRMKAIIAERKLSVNKPFLETLADASTDRSSIVRRVAAEFLIRELETLGEKALPFAKLFSSDSSSAVSERGDFVLRKLKEK